MSLYHCSPNRRSVENRRCPCCGRGMALKWSEERGTLDRAVRRRAVRYCRWSEIGKCDYTAEKARERRS